MSATRPAAILLRKMKQDQHGRVRDFGSGVVLKETKGCPGTVATT